MNKRMNKSKHHNTYIHIQVNNRSNKASFKLTALTIMYLQTVLHNLALLYGDIVEPEDEEDHDDTPEPHNFDFAAAGIELLCRLARGEMAPRLSLVSPKVFFSVLSPMEFWFLAAVASGLLSWGHLISSNIVDLIEQKLFELN